MLHLLRLMIEFRYHVTFLPDNLYEETPDIRRLQSLGVEVLRASRDALYSLWDGLDPVLGERPA